MTYSNPALIVIPARFGSKRLPGKPLLKLAGKTILERVVANANRAAQTAGNCNVVVATDDQRIADHAEEIGVSVEMTPTELDSGSARAQYAAHMQQPLSKNIINLQGDAPFIGPDIVTRMINALRTNDAQIATPVYKLDWARLDRLREHKKTAPFSGTTCTRDAQGRALWFSKSILPAMRWEENLRSQSNSPVWQHLGLYGYAIDALDWFVAAPRSIYEQLEGLEQLRFIENGWKIATLEVEPPEHAMSGIDTPADLELARQAIDRLGEPFER